MFGIKSRTENWTTARTFAPIITFNQQFYIANRIIENHTGKNPEFKENEVRIELFAKGFRDYMHNRGIAQTNVGFVETTVQSYDSIFPLLRNSICDYLITIMLQPLRTILRVSCSGGLNHGQEQGSVSKKHEYSCLYSALW